MMTFDNEELAELKFLVNRRLNDILFSLQKMSRTIYEERKKQFEPEIVTLKLLQSKFDKQ